MFPVFGGFAVSTLLLGLLTCWLSTPQKRKRRTPEDLPFHLSHPSHEQRGAVRCGRHSVRVLIRTGEEEKPQEGWVIDRSTGGFGFLLIAPAVAWSTGPVGDKSVLEVRPTNAPFDCSWVRVEIRHIGPGYRPGRSPGRRRIGRFHRSQLGSRENGSIKSRSGSRGRVDRGIRTPAELPFGTVAQNRAVETGRLFELGNCRRNHAKLFGTDGGAKVDHDSPKMASDKVVLCCRAIPFSRYYRSFLLALLSPPAL